jgi:hypothetical protein
MSEARATAIRQAKTAKKLRDNAAALKTLSDALNEISELKHFRECDDDECVCHVGIATKALGWEVNND